MAHIKAKLLEDAMQDSWVDLGVPSSRDSSGSLACTISAIAIDANYSNKGSRHSPKSLHSPNVEVNPMLEAVKFRLAREVNPPRDSDWLWDWSSRPEKIPPKQYRFRHPGGTMTTPPNSPVLSSGSSDRRTYAICPFSIRHTKMIRSEVFSVEILSLFIVSNVLSLCIGYWICQKLTQANHSF